MASLGQHEEFVNHSKFDLDVAMPTYDEDATAQLRRQATGAYFTALVSARDAEDYKPERALRVLVDAAPYSQCPACSDTDTLRPRCQECHGDGFVSD